MSRIDIAIPSYRGLVHPRAKEAMDALLTYSSCQCFSRNADLSWKLYEAAKSGKRVQNLPKFNPFHHPSECPYGKHDIHVIPQVNASIVHWARNSLLEHRRKDADFVMFCDDDIVLQPNALEILLRYKKDIVAGLCVRRVDPPEPNFFRWIEEIQNYGIILKWPVGKFMEVDAIGTGLMLVSRKVIEEMALTYHKKRYLDDGTAFWFEFLYNPQGRQWGEDVSFCYKAQRMGYSVWADTKLISYHMGDYNYGVEDYLDHQKAVIEAGGLAAFRQKEREKATAVWQQPEPDPEPVGV